MPATQLCCINQASSAGVYIVLNYVYIYTHILVEQVCWRSHQKGVWKELLKLNDWTGVYAVLQVYAWSVSYYTIARDKSDSFFKEIAKEI